MKFVLIWQTTTLRFVLMMRFMMQQKKLAADKVMLMDEAHHQLPHPHGTSGRLKSCR